MHIALLEDNPTNSQFIQTMLEMAGHLVFPHPQGHSLLAALRTIEEVSRYDAIIIDLWLPDSLSGQQVMRLLQEQYAVQPLPFIVVSALSQQELNCVQADFPETPLIRKPFKSRQLFEAIQWVTNRSGTAPPKS